MNLEQHIAWIIQAHANHPKKTSKAFRRWDGRTPYAIHPLWCATTILAETTLDEQTRQDGALALLYHDIIEDTMQSLPDELPERIKELVQHMTVESTDTEIVEVWTKPKEIKLYKLYDKISNLLDGSWMNPERRKQYEDYTSKLCRDVEKNYGILNITKIARAITKVIA